MRFPRLFSSHFFYSSRKPLSAFLVQKMLNFQNLQNLASLQQQKLGFVGLAGLSSPSTCLNSPLNLSLSSSSHPDSNQINTNCNATIASELAKSLCAANAENFSPQMPQLILASVSEIHEWNDENNCSLDMVSLSLSFSKLGWSTYARCSSCTAFNTITTR